jgi:mRNA-degrading endonuclease RelE of RelBE toxin-antitoxin system
MGRGEWRLLRNPRFDKIAAALPPNILDKLEQVLKKLEEEGPFDSQLQVKKQKAKSEGVYACRLGRNYPLSFSVDGENRRIRLRNVGSRQNFYDDA